MNISTIAPFVDAVALVGEELVKHAPTRGELAVTQALVTSCPINIVTAVSGDIEGVVLFGLTRESALGIAEAILDIKLRVLDQSVSAALTEFGERILEKDSAALKFAGFEFQLTPPALIRGINLEIPTKGQPAIIVPLHFEGIGSILVALSVLRRRTEKAA